MKDGEEESIHPAWTEGQGKTDGRTGKDRRKDGEGQTEGRGRTDGDGRTGKGRRKDGEGQTEGRGRTDGEGQTEGRGRTGTGKGRRKDGDGQTGKDRRKDGEEQTGTEGRGRTDGDGRTGKDRRGREDGEGQTGTEGRGRTDGDGRTGKDRRGREDGEGQTGTEGRGRTDGDGRTGKDRRGRKDGRVRTGTNGDGRGQTEANGESRPNKQKCHHRHQTGTPAATGGRRRRRQMRPAPVPMRIEIQREAPEANANNANNANDHHALEHHPPFDCRCAVLSMLGTASFVSIFVAINSVMRQLTAENLMFLIAMVCLCLNKGYPVIIKYLRGTVYSMDNKPTCYRNRPTILLPGIGRLFEGEMTVPPNSYDLIKSGTVNMTIKSPNFDDPLCVNGVSQYIALPNSMCVFNLCDFIGRNLCEFLQRPGTHTIREMEEKIGFNSTLILPDAPGILGISLLDIFAGEFHFVFSVETEGKVITNLETPINMQYVPLGLREEEGEEEKHC
ncbi:hypothetical protein GPALN_010839 [Globodera pallida]|nr:hypothetical protein GPALN_010839 [Globodera pallida]